MASPRFHHSSEATRQVTHQAGDALRTGAAAGSAMTQAGAQVSADTARRAGGTLADAQRQILEQVSEQYETMGRHLAQRMQESAADLRTLFVPLEGAAESLRDLQDGMAGLVTGVVQSNLRATQELLRMADPGAVLDLQRQFVRDYLDTLLQGAGAFIRVTRQATEQSLRPIEARLAERQNGSQEQGRQTGERQSVVSDVMSSDVRVVTPDDTVQQASRLMRDEDTGILPVGEGDRLVGVVTDRDVTLRLVAEGKDPARTKVREVMSQELKYVFEDEDLAHVADNMAQQQLRRMPVVNRNKRLVGVVSLGDLTRAGRSGRYAGRALRGIAAAE